MDFSLSRARPTTCCRSAARPKLRFPGRGVPRRRPRSLNRCFCLCRRKPDRSHVGGDFLLFTAANIGDEPDRICFPVWACLKRSRAQTLGTSGRQHADAETLHDLADSIGIFVSTHNRSNGCRHAEFHTPHFQWRPSVRTCWRQPKASQPVALRNNGQAR